MAKNGITASARKTLIGLLLLLLVMTGAVITGVVLNQTDGKVKLALDLEGGTQMVLAPIVEDTEGDNQLSQETLDQAVEIIRQRVDGSGVSEAEITTQGGRNVVVSMPGIPDPETRRLIQASAAMEFRPVIAAGAGTAVPEEDRTPEAEIPEPTGEPENGSDPNWVTKELYQEFEATDCMQGPGEQDRAATKAEEPMVACDYSTGEKFILGPMEVKGSDISDASFGLVQSNTGVSTGMWAVNLSFNNEGTEAFRKVTTRLAPLQGNPNRFAVVLDDAVISAPTTNAVIPNGQAQISGNFDENSAKALSEQLKYGALPISFDIQSEQQISATLGTDQLRMGLWAGIIGLILVAVYSIFQYRMLGLVTIASLVVAGVLTYLAIVLLGWSDNYRLSLAGIAGLIVAIGLTADSFIVYFERIKDELRNGRELIGAVEHGWERARRTVLASKAVNLLAAVVLYFVAVGNVRGFAFTLGLTAVADLVVVFLFTHPVMQLLATTRFFGQGHRASGLDPSLLGVVPLYQGAGKIRGFNPTPVMTSGKGKAKGAKAKKEAARRMSIAERKRQAALEHSSSGAEETKND
ncbi:protein translocase subunit SecD [Micrococcoides hystricis]|uniref:Protein translocase subunit SecD n=1 Tax=Micrococcoides hystricis TaxID=1572761 RepID=A0ABV6P7I6_9MICC